MAWDDVAMIKARAATATNLTISVLHVQLQWLIEPSLGNVC
jgi:hypothetical protein